MFGGQFDIRTMVVGFMAIIISITVHEFAHAWVADKLGDDTPRRHGRVTLNPLVIMKAHPIGSILAPLLGAANGVLFGWAATPVNPANVRRGVSMRTADLLISVAGPVSNVLLAFASVGLFYGLAAVGGEFMQPLVQLAAALVIANILLAIFNLIPVPPLDGYHVLSSKAPPGWRGALEFIEQYSFVLFILVFMYAGRLLWPLLRALTPDIIYITWLTGGAA